MIEFSPVRLIRHLFQITLRWQIRQILLYKVWLIRASGYRSVCGP